eukprot:COSAG01_NODE_9047_length_2570_cov_44.923917_1_plen_72_part_00
MLQHTWRCLKDGVEGCRTKCIQESARLWPVHIVMLAIDIAPFARPLILHLDVDEPRCHQRKGLCSHFCKLP